MKLLVVVCVLALCVGCQTEAKVETTAATASKPIFGDPVQTMIDKGVAALIRLRRNDGSWPPYSDSTNRWHAGATALATWALLECGVSPEEPQMAATLEWLAAQDEAWTYTRALKCNVWHAANRVTKGKYREHLLKDGGLVITSSLEGSWTYMSAGTPLAGDNSNSHYGSMGVEALANEGIEIPDFYWNKLIGHWIATQCDDGGWHYQGRAASGNVSMTLGAIASLRSCGVLSGKIDTLGKGPDALERGRAWMDSHATALAGKDGYVLFNLSRAALAQGYKCYGNCDWYREAVKVLAANQRPNGLWSGRWGDTAETSFGLLFLVHCRRPVLVAKLQHGGDWNRRPGDAMRLTQHIENSHNGVRLNWQIVRTADAADNWIDAPILLITGIRDPGFASESLARIKAHVAAGGSILTVVGQDGTAFDLGMRAAYARILPASKLEKPLRDDPLYSGIKPSAVKLPAVEILRFNGRTVIIHCGDGKMEEELARQSTPQPVLKLLDNIVTALAGGIQSLNARGSGIPSVTAGK